ICHNCHSKASSRAASDAHKPKDCLIGRFGRVFVHARADVLQTQTILKGTATQAPDGSYRRLHKVGAAYLARIKDARERGKMIKEAKLLVQKCKGDNERGGEEERPSKRAKNAPATSVAKRASLKNVARMSAPVKQITEKPAAKNQTKPSGKI
ncbi:hypothetical protein BDK51DRAFT_33006, partial [Blyttiomyces helicus]